MDFSELNHFIDTVVPEDARGRIAFLLEDLCLEGDPVMGSKAYSYIRFSSAKQERGDSLRRQTTLANEYAAKHNLILDTSSYQDLGVSAFKGQNVEVGRLGAFIQAIDDGIVEQGSYLLVENLDRISRAQIDEALELFLSIIRRGITIVTLQDQQVYSRERIRQDRGISLIVSITYLMRAHEESATKSRRVKEAWDAKRVSGEILTAMAPPWLRLSEDRKKWMVVGEQAKKVQRIFELAKDGFGTPTIARKLNEAEVPPFRAELWTNGTVAHVLTNRAVIGTYTPKKANALPVEGYYPAIIDPTLFWSVQNGMQARKWKGGGNEEYVRNLFTGICYCGYCGSRAKFVSSSKPNYYLRCTKAYSNAGCSAERVLYRELEWNGIEREVLVWLLIDREQAFPHNEADTTSGERAVIEGELATKKEQLDRAMELQLAGSRRAAHEIVRLEDDIDRLTEQLRKYIEPAGEDAFRALNQTIDDVLRMAQSKQPDLDEKIRLRSAARGAMQRLLERVELYNDLKVVEGVEHRKVVLQLRDGGERHELWVPLPSWGINGTRKRA